MSPPPCSQISSSSPSNSLKRCRRVTDSSSSLSRNSNRLTSPWPPTALPYLLRRSEEGPCSLSKPESPWSPLSPPKPPPSPSNINFYSIWPPRQPSTSSPSSSRLELSRKLSSQYCFGCWSGGQRLLPDLSGLQYGLAVYRLIHMLILHLRAQLVLKMSMDPWNTKLVHQVKPTLTGQLKWLWD